MWAPFARAKCMRRATAAYYVDNRRQHSEWCAARRRSVVCRMHEQWTPVQSGGGQGVQLLHETCGRTNVAATRCIGTLM